MKLCDVNVYVYAHRPDSTPEHLQYALFLKKLVEEEIVFALSPYVLSGFIRVVTNGKIFKNPTPIDLAIKFCRQLLDHPNARLIQPGSSHWELFERICIQSRFSGKLTADAFHAALALEYDCEWISTDSDFSRITGLKWSHPLKPTK